MYLSLDWLKDFVRIPRSITPEELGLRLTMHTVEIDSIEKQVDKFKNIVVGKILTLKKHPNASRLQLVWVDAGSEKFEIVCGAPNLKEGQLVPLAKVGAVLPNGLEIKESEIRGVKSVGMLCAEDELGLGDDHSGILILDNKAKIGQNLAEHYKLKDVIFEVDNKSITHRPDLWSHYGMAREIAAFLKEKFRKYKPNKKVLTRSTNDIKLKMKVESYRQCPRYMAIGLTGIKIEASPKWMQERLIACGMRPINNIVDVTNYVMLELGQPLHAFDRTLVDEIIVRQAKADEVIETLDGEKRNLDNETLVIADSKKAIAIAGIMGGANSEINNKTDSMIIESANFNFVSIRKTSQKLGLRSDASMRFEKALDPNLCELALVRAVELIKKLCPKTKVASNLVDLTARLAKSMQSGEEKFKLNQGPIELNLSWLNKLVGEIIEARQVIRILTSLGFELVEKKDKLSVIVPTWRATRDISIPEDLVEEVARIYGYSNLTPAMPKIAMKAAVVNQERVLERKIKDILAKGAALTEIYNYSFVGEEQLKKISIDFSSHIRLANPITAQQTMLRQNLAANLIENVKVNQARYSQVGLFEIGSIYLNNPGEINKDNKSRESLPYQEKRIGIILAAQPSSPGKKREDVFVRTKGLIEYLLNALNLPVIFSPTEAMPGWADKKIAANILISTEESGRVAKKDIGLVAKLDNGHGIRAGLKKEVVIAEINFNDLFILTEQSRMLGADKYKAYMKYPSAVRDLAFVVDEKILYNDIRDEIMSFHKLIKHVELFDVYQGDKLGANKKNLAFHITYLAPDRTLTASEVDEIQQGLIKQLDKKFSAKIRDF